MENNEFWVIPNRNKPVLKDQILNETPQAYYSSNRKLKKASASPPKQTYTLKGEIETHHSILNHIFGKLSEILTWIESEKESTEKSLYNLTTEIIKETSRSQQLQSKQTQNKAENLAKTMNLKAQISHISDSIENLSNEIYLIETENSSLNSEFESMLKEREKLESEIEFSSQKIQSTISKTKKNQEFSRSLQLEIQEKTEQIEYYQNERLECHRELKLLNNQLQKLKGNIRVFCRIRPLHPNSTPVEITHTEKELHLTYNQKTHSFFFDKIFPQSSTQPEIFSEISQLVQSALDGYNVCIFAYGQTGSGKTFTMEGPAGSNLLLEDDSQESKGIIQRSLEQLFQSSEFLSDLGWTYTFSATIIEIYNEQVRDLLNNSETLEGISTNLMNPLSVEVRSYSDLYPLLARARHERKQAQTQCNAYSSRSHCIFQLKIQGIRGNEEVKGVLNMIDLAGSERLKISQAEGERLEETKAINKSLSALGDVIQAIAKKEKHVPFRNSKLTSVLQNCLGGEGKTLMFVNISPDEVNSNETSWSLRFAEKVTTCRIG